MGDTLGIFTIFSLFENQPQSKHWVGNGEREMAPFFFPHSMVAYAMADANQARFRDAKNPFHLAKKQVSNDTEPLNFPSLMQIRQLK